MIQMKQKKIFTFHRNIEELFHRLFPTSAADLRTTSRLFVSSQMILRSEPLRQSSSTRPPLVDNTREAFGRDASPRLGGFYMVSSLALI